MMDYNDGLLPEPCLRMDTHFGDDYESVEFGDGTGYVKAAPMLAKLGALHVELDELRDENAKLQASNEVIAEDHAALCEHNAKLRELVLCLLTCSSDTGDACDRCPVNGGAGIWDFEDFCDSLLDRVHELRIELNA